VPHTVAPEERPEAFELDVGGDRVVLDAMESGLNGVVIGEPEGMALALQVRAQVQRSVALSQVPGEILNKRRTLNAQAEYVKEHLHCLLWEYLRQRMMAGIPAVDPQLPAGEPEEVGGAFLGPLLGRGIFGGVHRLEVIGGPPEMVRLVDKSYVHEIPELQRLKRTISAMRAASSPEWLHENVARLNNIYHSKSHLILRMELAGNENLGSRLAACSARPLGPAKATAIVAQALAAVCHLHLGPGICLRDLRPQSFFLDEGPERLSLKLGAFDSACILDGHALCRSALAKLPFAAPEALLEPQHNGFAADLWSLGVVLLEALCGPGVLERHLKGPGQQATGRHARHLRDCLEQPGAVQGLLKANAKQELQELALACDPLAVGLLDVDVAARWTASQVAEALIDLRMQQPVQPQ